MFNESELKKMVRANARITKTMNHILNHEEEEWERQELVDFCAFLSNKLCADYDTTLDEIIRNECGYELQD
jgi:hypothetical protein